MSDPGDDDGVRGARFALGQHELAVLSVPLPSLAALETLSVAEREVVDHVLAGLSSKEIGEARDTSARTVANQLASIYRKLSVCSRSELVARLVGGPVGPVH